MVKTSPSNRGCGFDLWSGSQDPTFLAAKKLKHKAEAILQQIQGNLLKWSTLKTKQNGTGRNKVAFMTPRMCGLGQIIRAVATLEDSLSLEPAWHLYSWCVRIL